MKRILVAIATFALLGTAVAPSAFAQDRADYGTEGETTEESGYRNVDIYEAGRFRMRDKRDYENIIILGPIFIPPGMSVRYDRGISDRFSVVAGFGLGILNLDDGDDGESASLRSFRFLAGANWQPIGNGMHGFFVGPRIRYNTYNVSVDCSDGEECSDGSVGTLGIGAVLGWRWIWDPGFSLGLGLGGQYFSVVSESSATYSDGSETGSGSVSYDGFLPAFEFTLGWAF